MTYHSIEGTWDEAIAHADEIETKANKLRQDTRCLSINRSIPKRRKENVL